MAGPSEESGFLDKMRGFLVESFGNAKDAVGHSLETLKQTPELATKVSAEAVVDGVTQNSGMTGNAVRSMQDYNQRQAEAMRELGL